MHALLVKRIMVAFVFPTPFLRCFSFDPRKGAPFSYYYYQGLACLKKHRTNLRFCTVKFCKKLAISAVLSVTHEWWLFLKKTYRRNFEKNR